MSKAVRTALLTTIGRRLTPQPIKLRADIELTCFTPAGIDAIKDALKAGEGVSSATVPIKAKLVAPPFYVLGTNATDRVSFRRQAKAITQPTDWLGLRWEELKNSKRQSKPSNRRLKTLAEL